MPQGPKPTPELVAAIRRCAAEKMSMAATAELLYTRAHPLTRSAIAGIAKRNGISFSAPGTGLYGRKPRNKTTTPPARTTPAVRNKIYRAASAAPQQIHHSVVMVNARPGVRPPGLQCGWCGCTEPSEAGDMFCYRHARKQLFG